jgi:hypothetical protein
LLFTTTSLDWTDRKVILYSRETNRGADKDIAVRTADHNQDLDDDDDDDVVFFIATQPRALFQGVQQFHFFFLKLHPSCEMCQEK